MAEINGLFPEKEIISFKLNKVIKRDGRIVAFNKDKITDAIFRAAVEIGGSDREMSDALANKVVAMMNQVYAPEVIPSVEEIQDLTERVLGERRPQL